MAGHQGLRRSGCCRHPPLPLSSRVDPPIRAPRFHSPGHCFLSTGSCVSAVLPPRFPFQWQSRRSSFASPSPVCQPLPFHPHQQPPQNLSCVLSLTLYHKTPSQRAPRRNRARRVDAFQDKGSTRKVYIYKRRTLSPIWSFS